MHDVVVCGAAIVKDEARVAVDDVPDQPGVSHRIFSAIAEQEHRRRHDRAERRHRRARRASASPCSATNCPRRCAVLEPLAAEMGAAIEHEEDVSKVSVVGTGMRDAHRRRRSGCSRPSPRPAST